MCWSGEASTALASAGLASTTWAAYKKEPPGLWLCLGYFSLMEALQAYTYTVINQCALPANQVATMLGYLHIVFQPFFINTMGLYFIPPRIATKIAPFVYTLCFASAIVMLLQLYPFDWAGHCLVGEAVLCGDRLCSVSGNWHIAWEVPANGIGNMFVVPPWSHGSYITYIGVAFLLPLLYGSWRGTLYHLVMGPFLATMLTDNLNEQPAVWCLLSIGMLMIVVKTPFRQVLHVRRWIFWPAEKAVDLAGAPQTETGRALPPT